MKRILMTILLFAGILLTFAVKQPRGFAIVVDQRSLEEARQEIDAYAQAVEKVNGLKTIIVVDRWGVPDSIRAELIRLYNDKSCPIAGAVLVGDIPVAMIRDAQFLTSAFRMDQRRAWQESSCPSDRFYDDFGMEFKFLCREDSLPYFYYSLGAEGEQRVRQSIFSGRIRPTDAGGSSRYEKLRRYLRKAVAAKYEDNILDKAFYFTGHGSLNESRVAAIDEKANMYEHFPWMLTMRAGISYMDYGQEKYIKQSMMNELMREDLDYAVLHHHGDYDTQYLSGPVAKDADEGEKLMADLHLEDFADYGFAPNCRYVSFDACYNGSFHRDDCIANEYIFGSGKTIAVLGGTVNVLQDKWYDKMVGLLGLGVYAGYISAYQHYLEIHIVGDPTFTFRPTPGPSREGRGVGEDLNALIAASWRGEVKAKQLKRLLRDGVHADVQCLALEMLNELGEPGFGPEFSRMGEDTLLDLLEHSPLSQVRMQALQMLALRGGDSFVKGLQLGASDRNEMVQRFTMNFIRQNGDPRLIPALVRVLLLNNASARVRFDAEEAMKMMPKDEMSAEIGRQRSGLVSTNADSMVTKLLQRAESMQDFWNERIDRLVSDSLSDKGFEMTGSSLRLYLPQGRVPEVIGYVQRRTTPDDRKIKLTEALGWYVYSHYRPQITAFAKALSEDMAESDSVRYEALKTYQRVR